MSWRTRGTAVLASVVASASLLAAPPSHADALPACPHVAGWDGPVASPNAIANELTGDLGCQYTPPAALGYAAGTMAVIVADWAGRAATDPGDQDIMGGCTIEVISQEGIRWISSPTSWASISYEVITTSDNGTTYVPREDLLLANERVLRSAVDALAQDVFARAHPCSTLTSRVVRTAGADRYATAALISEAWATAGTVYVATGADFPDALAAGPAAAAEEAPILLVRRDDVPAPTAAALTRLRPSEIVVLGGTAVVSEGVVAALGAYADTVVRIGGADRYATALAVVRRAFPEPAPLLFISSGADFADPIIAGAAAAGAGAPLLLVDGSAPADPSVVAYLSERPSDSFAYTVAPPGALDQVLSSLPIGDYQRIEDRDVPFRASRLLSLISAPVSSVTIATLGGFADALAATPAAARTNSPLVLARAACIDRYVLTEMERLQPATVRLIGGTGALSNDVGRFGVCSR